MSPKPEERAAVLKEAADWYFDVHDLHEDGDLDPDDHLKIIQRAFASSDCDAFAHVLHAMTGWTVVRAAWTIPEWGFGHHALVRSPDGRLLDVTGWTDEKALAKRYRARKSLNLSDTEPDSDSIEPEEDGIDRNYARIVAIVRALPYAPFDAPEFQEMSLHPVPGADISLKGEHSDTGPAAPH